MGTYPDRGGIRGGYGEVETDFADSVPAWDYRARNGNVLPAVPVPAVREMQFSDAGRAQEHEERAGGVLPVPGKGAKADAVACRGLPRRSTSISRRW